MSSIAKHNWATGEKVQNSDLNALANIANAAGGYDDAINAGETISGATTPVPVYIDQADGEAKACDANVITKLKVVAFAISDSTDGNPINLQSSGVVGGFTGLTAGAKYYVQDSVGTIGKTPGTYVVPVGVAVSSTKLRIEFGDIVVYGSLSSSSRNPSSNQTINDDETITFGVRPKVIKIYADVTATAWGVTPEDHGWVTYDGAITGGATRVGGETYDGGSGGAQHYRAHYDGSSLGASKVDSSIGVSVSYGLYSISDTGFTVRASHVGASSGGGAGAVSNAKYIAIL